MQGELPKHGCEFEEVCGSFPYTFGTQEVGENHHAPLVGRVREGISTCRSKGFNRELIEKRVDDVIASQSLQGKIKNMEAVEDFESRRQKVVFIPGKMITHRFFLTAYLRNR